LVLGSEWVLALRSVLEWALVLVSKWVLALAWRRG
jgi:hypothetical protein